MRRVWMCLRRTAVKIMHSCSLPFLLHSLYLSSGRRNGSSLKSALASRSARRKSFTTWHLTSKIMVARVSASNGFHSGIRGVVGIAGAGEGDERRHHVARDFRGLRSRPVIDTDLSVLPNANGMSTACGERQIRRPPASYQMKL